MDNSVVGLLMNRFIEHHKVINYNPQTRELAIKNWGKYNLLKAGSRSWIVFMPN
jgi:hypothetical protein